MRYMEEPSVKESRNDAKYIYYSYKYIGVKPTSYNAFEVNGGGVNNLLRTLTLSCDMCLVDLTGDVTVSGSTNIGNRSEFIFGNSPSTGSGSQPDPEESPENKEPDHKQELQEQQEQLEQQNADFGDLSKNIQ